MVRINAAQIRRRLKRQVDAIPTDRLKSAEDYLTYLQDRDAIDATAELLRIPGALGRLKKAERQARDGRLTSVRDLKRRKSR